jgi:hypothetical protein
MDAAKAFEEESGTSCGPVDATSMERMAIRSAVECGNLMEAIERVNDLNPEACSSVVLLCAATCQEIAIMDMSAVRTAHDMPYGVRAAMSPCRSWMRSLPLFSAYSSSS